MNLFLACVIDHAPPFLNHRAENMNMKCMCMVTREVLKILQCKVDCARFIVLSSTYTVDAWCNTGSINVDVHSKMHV